MGLDMYLTGNKDHWTNWESPEKNKKEDGFEVCGTQLRLGYWRKHPDLHGYIVDTFAEGVDECQEILLDADNIQNIIDAVKGDALPKTSGFFFGESDGSEKDETIKIFEAAIEWLSKGDSWNSRSVIYRASW